MPDIRFAQLRTISLSRLKILDPTSLRRLDESSTECGVFHLDLAADRDENLMTNNEHCLAIAKQLYDTPETELRGFDIDQIGNHKLDGYKPLGRNAGVTKSAADGFVAFLASVNRSDDIGETILRALGHVAGLPADNGYELQHRPRKDSTSAFGMLKYPSLSEESSNLGHGAHTDVGSLTILFSTEPGLQVKMARKQDWEFVETKPGCAIVNLGDSLRFMSGLRFASCLHRVVPFPEKEIKDRYSMAYFMRPEYNVRLVDSSGKIHRSIDWHDQKYRVFRAPVVEQEQSSVLTGTRGYTGLWSPAEAGHDAKVA